jgi:hypothetical protein
MPIDRYTWNGKWWIEVVKSFKMEVHSESTALTTEGADLSNPTN